MKNPFENNPLGLSEEEFDGVSKLLKRLMDTSNSEEKYSALQYLSLGQTILMGAFVLCIENGISVTECLDMFNKKIASSIKHLICTYGDED